MRAAISPPLLGQNKSMDGTLHEMTPEPRRILLAPVGMMDPLHFGKAVDYRAPAKVLIKEARKLEKRIPQDAYTDLSRLHPDVRLGPLLGAIRRMSEGPELAWSDRDKDDQITEKIIEAMGERVARLRKPWLPDEVWLLFEGAADEEEESPMEVRALLSCALIKRLFGPWIRVSPVRLSDAKSYKECWQALCEQADGYFSAGPGDQGDPSSTESEDSAGSPSSSSSDQDEPAEPEEVFDFSSLFGEEPPSPWSEKSPPDRFGSDLRILYGSGTQAMRHALFLLDRVLPESTGRMWQPMELRGEAGREDIRDATATPLLWHWLGHPVLGPIEQLRLENEALRAELQQARSSLQTIRASLLSVLEEVSSYPVLDHETN